MYRSRPVFRKRFRPAPFPVLVLVLSAAILTCTGPALASPASDMVMGMFGATGPTANLNGTDISAHTGDANNLPRTAPGQQVDGRVGPADAWAMGRQIASRLTGGKKVLAPDASLSRYVASVGTSLALASQAPYLYDGYTFMVVEDPNADAWATPGGFVIVTTGMLKNLRDEDELAALLGHEIGHVEMKHGMVAVNDAMMTGRIQGQTVYSSAAGSRDASEATIDVLMQAIRNGYSMDFEREADRRGMALAHAVGYDPYALGDILQRFAARAMPWAGARGAASRSGTAMVWLEDNGVARASRLSIREERFKAALAAGAASPARQTAQRTPSTSLAGTNRSFRQDPHQTSRPWTSQRATGSMNGTMAGNQAPAAGTARTPASPPRQTATADSGHYRYSGTARPYLAPSLRPGASSAAGTPSYMEAPARPASPAAYVVQLGAYSNPANADKMAREASMLGFQTETVRQYSPRHRRDLILVRIPGQISHDAALNTRKAWMRASGRNAFVMKR